MSQSQRSESMDNRLRATATAFTPHIVAGTRPSLERYQPTSYSSYSTAAASDVSTYSESSDRMTDMSIRTTDSQPNTTTSINDCALCISLGQILDCCASATGPRPRPCSHCAEVGRLIAQEKRKHDDAVIALQARMKQLETVSPEEKYERLCIEKNMKIEAFKMQKKEINKEDDMLKAEIEGQENALRILEDKIKKVQPAAQFTIKEGKTGRNT
jgi:hypothetical protein